MTEAIMPDKKTLERAEQDKREGKSPSSRAGVALKAPREGTVSPETRRHAQHDSAVGAKEAKAPSPKRSRATLSALKREGKSAASTAALSRQTKSAAKKRTAADRSAAARKAARTRSRSG